MATWTLQRLHVNMPHGYRVCIATWLQYEQLIFDSLMAHKGVADDEKRFSSSERFIFREDR